MMQDQSMLQLQTLNGQSLGLKVGANSAEVILDTDTVKTLSPYDSCTARLYPVDKLFDLWKPLCLVTPEFAAPIGEVLQNDLSAFGSKRERANC